MEQGAKKNFSFASIAISFFILIVLPLTITGVIISKGVIKVGEEATQANLRILDDNQKLSIAGRAQNVGEAVAQFLTDREKDVRIATILPRDDQTYNTFLKSNTRGVTQSSKVGIVKIPVPVYKEIAFLDKTGKETLKVTVDGVVTKDKLKDMSNPANGDFGDEDYFQKAKQLAPGDIYMGNVVGYHVTKQEFEAGKQFNGIIRIAAPVFDSTGFAGVVELALDFSHIMEFTGHIVPTEPRMVFAKVNQDDVNYTFLIGRDGSALAHPAQYLIGGLGPDKKAVPTMDDKSYNELIKTGAGGMNVLNMGFLDENLPKIHALAVSGKSGSFTYMVDNKRIFIAYAHIPYYGSVYSKPEGFGWVGMMVDIDKYHKLSEEKVKDIQLKVERWQKSSITVVFVSLILLFIIALILARGLYRSILKRDGAMPHLDDED